MSSIEFATDHMDRIISGMAQYRKENHRPAIDEPANDFEKSVNQLHDLQSLQAEIKNFTKMLNDDERQLRDGIAESLRKFFGDDLKEGMNYYPLSNRRKLKFENKIDRKVDMPSVEAAKNAFLEATKEESSTVTFDDVFRVKLELDKQNWKKLLAGSKLATAVSRCVVAKPAAPTIKVD